MATKPTFTVTLSALVFSCMLTANAAKAGPAEDAIASSCAIHQSRADSESTKQATAAMGSLTGIEKINLSVRPELGELARSIVALRAEAWQARAEALAIAAEIKKPRDEGEHRDFAGLTEQYRVAARRYAEVMALLATNEESVASAAEELFQRRDRALVEDYFFNRSTLVIRFCGPRQISIETTVCEYLDLRTLHSTVGLYLDTLDEELANGSASIRFKQLVDLSSMSPGEAAKDARVQSEVKRVLYALAATPIPKICGKQRVAAAPQAAAVVADTVAAKPVSVVAATQPAAPGRRAAPLQSAAR